MRLSVCMPAFYLDWLCLLVSDSAGKRKRRLCLPRLGWKETVVEKEEEEQLQAGKYQW